MPRVDNQIVDDLVAAIEDSKTLSLIDDQVAGIDVSSSAAIRDVSLAIDECVVSNDVATALDGDHLRSVNLRLMRPLFHRWRQLIHFRKPPALLVRIYQTMQFPP